MVVNPCYFVCAPMVDQSGLAFRELVRRYGVHLAYTPMLHAGMAASSDEYLRREFQTRSTDTPLVVQLAGDDADLVERTAVKVRRRALDLGHGVEPWIDLNLGCPQKIASRGNYGAFLFERDVDRAATVVHRLSAAAFQVSVKVRLLPEDDDDDVSKTIAACETLVAAGAGRVCVHGRTRKQNKQLAGAADWGKMSRLKEALVGVPVIANGGVSCRGDALRLASLGFDGVMSSEALLDNPALFSDEAHPSRRDLCREYLDLARDTDTLLNNARAHAFKMLHGSLSAFPDVRDDLARHVRSIDDIAALVDTLDTVLDPHRVFDLKGSSTDDDPDFDPRFSWYWRHRNKPPCLESQSLFQFQRQSQSQTNARDLTSTVAAAAAAAAAAHTKQERIERRLRRVRRRDDLIRRNTDSIPQQQHHDAAAAAAEKQ